MNTVMEPDEAYARAERELSHKRRQMTHNEYSELFQDRVRALLGARPIARLEGGRRLTDEETMIALRTVDAFLGDMHATVQFGDARFYGTRRLVALFRLTERLDVGCPIEVRALSGRMNVAEAMQHACVQIYDQLTPEFVAGKLRE